MDDLETKYWKSPVETTLDDPSYENLDISRRKFMKLMGASMAMMTASCRRPVHKIFPYVKQPENRKPGVAEYFASTFSLNNHAYGVLVKTKDGRPVKIEGNPDHPSSQGAAGTYAQASVLELYDPARLRKPNLSSWSQWYKQVGDILNQARDEEKRVRIISESVTSPSLSSLKKEYEKDFGDLKWYEFEPFSQETIRSSYKAAFGRNNIPKVHLDKAEIILSLGSDFLSGNLDSLTHSRNWAKGRKIRSVIDKMNRLYVVESTYSTTGANADHRLPVKPSKMVEMALHVAKLLVFGFNVSADYQTKTFLKQFSIHLSELEKEFLGALAEDLAKNKGKAVVMAGEQESKDLQIVSHLLNSLIGSYGKTIDNQISTFGTDNGLKSLEPLFWELKSERVDVLILIGGNPVYHFGKEFEGYVKKVPNTIRLGLYYDETARAAKYIAPISHYLESWGDAQTEDGAMSLIQPTIRPIHKTQSVGEILSKLKGKKWHAHIKSYWRTNVYSKMKTFGSFDSFWRAALHNGVVKTSLPSKKSFRFNSSVIGSIVKKINAESSGLELKITSSASTYDGRFSNNGWLQELPDPITKTTWDNLACMSAKTAQKQGLHQGDRIEITAENKTVILPVFIQPGLALNVITTTSGYGRTSAGDVGNKVGANTFQLGEQLSYSNVSIKKLSGKHKIATTQGHDSMEGREIVREATLEEYRKDPEFAKKAVHHPPLKNLDKEFEYKGHHWGMTIDLNSCVGCNGCVVACDVENNVPIVGKEQVLKSREMHWLRIDRYYEGSSDNPKTVQQPMLCQHCDNAPCETVCPVAATTHSDEGLNDMTYNRCVGTRYCSNNCPYKVRRFNFFDYNVDIEHPQELGKNPDVTVRMRGIMEKCTFCVQRINDGKIKAKVKGQDRVTDGKVVTACQQSCPTQAIVFGDMNDPKSEVSKLMKAPQGYHVLGELNVKPSITYLAVVRNPHPRLKENKHSGKEHH